MNNEIYEVFELLKDKKFSKLRTILDDMNPADIAWLLNDASRKDTLILFRLLSKELAAETFTYLSNDMQQHLIEVFSDNEVKDVLDELFMDDTVDLIEEMPANVVNKILKNTDNDSRKIINELLNYPKYSAGSIMTTEYVALKKSMSVEEAFVHIKEVGVNKETIYNCYVIDNRTLVGMVSAKDLLLANRQDMIADIMITNVKSVDTHDDQEEVANIFTKYGFLAMPVVDREKRLVGIITFDDVLDVIHEEAEEDIEKMAAIIATDTSYMETNVIDTWKKRIPWLLILMLSATFTGQIIQAFENRLATHIVLTAFIPMLMGTGGNAGGQVSATIIRGLSMNEILYKDMLSIIWKEIRVAVLCGVTLAVSNFFKMLIVDRVDVSVALVVCITLVAVVIVAKVVGCILPVIAKRIGVDPAVMASPFITTIVDAISLLIYFAIAGVLLGV